MLWKRILDTQGARGTYALLTAQGERLVTVVGSVNTLPVRQGDVGNKAYPLALPFFRFKIPLLEGRVCYVELPEGWTQGDVKKLVKVVGVMFSDGTIEAE